MTYKLGYCGQALQRSSMSARSLAETNVKEARRGNLFTGVLFTLVVVLCARFVPLFKSTNRVNRAENVLVVLCIFKYANKNLMRFHHFLN